MTLIEVVLLIAVALVVALALVAAGWQIRGASDERRGGTLDLTPAAARGELTGLAWNWPQGPLGIGVPTRHLQAVDSG